jgi:hypothetical protein
LQQWMSIILAAISRFSGLSSDLGSGRAGRMDFTWASLLCCKNIHIIFTGHRKYSRPNECSSPWTLLLGSWEREEETHT